MPSVDSLKRPAPESPARPAGGPETGGPKKKNTEQPQAAHTTLPVAHGTTPPPPSTTPPPKADLTYQGIRSSAPLETLVCLCKTQENLRDLQKDKLIGTKIDWEMLTESVRLHPLREATHEVKLHEVDGTEVDGTVGGAKKSGGVQQVLPQNAHPDGLSVSFSPLPLRTSSTSPEGTTTTPPLRFAVSEKIKIAENLPDGKNRGYVAAADLNPGDVLLIEKPFLGALDLEIQRHACSHASAWAELRPDHEGLVIQFERLARKEPGGSPEDETLECLSKSFQAGANARGAWESAFAPDFFVRTLHPSDVLKGECLLKKKRELRKLMKHHPDYPHVEMYGVDRVDATIGGVEYRISSPAVRPLAAPALKKQKSSGSEGNGVGEPRHGDKSMELDPEERWSEDEDDMDLEAEVENDVLSNLACRFLKKPRHPRKTVNVPPDDPSDRTNDIFLQQQWRLRDKTRYNSLGFYTNSEQFCYPLRWKKFEGTGVFLLASIFNHSCSPNVSRYCIGDVAIFVTQKKVKKGEELCFSYIETTALADKKKLRDRLLDRDFVCACEKCATEQTAGTEAEKNINVPAPDARQVNTKPPNNESKKGSGEGSEEEDSEGSEGSAEESDDADEENFLQVDAQLQAQLYQLSPKEAVEEIDQILNNPEISIFGKDRQELKNTKAVALFRTGDFAASAQYFEEELIQWTVKHVSPLDDSLIPYLLFLAVAELLVATKGSLPSVVSTPASTGGEETSVVPSWEKKLLQFLEVDVLPRHIKIFGGGGSTLAGEDPLSEARTFFKMRYEEEIHLIFTMVKDSGKIPQSDLPRWCQYFWDLFAYCGKEPQGGTPRFAM